MTSCVQTCFAAAVMHEMIDDAQGNPYRDDAKNNGSLKPLSNVRTDNLKESTSVVSLKDAALSTRLVVEYVVIVPP